MTVHQFRETNTAQLIKFSVAKLTTLGAKEAKTNKSSIQYLNYNSHPDVDVRQPRCEIRPSKLSSVLLSQVAHRMV